MIRQTIETSRINRSVFGFGNKYATQRETLSGTLTIDSDSANVLILDPGGAARTVVLPAEADGLIYTITNSGDGVTEYLTITDDAAGTIVVIGIGETVTLRSNGTTWFAEGNKGGGVVASTATQITMTAGAHAGKTLKIAATAPCAVTLPAATGTGNKYKIVVSVAATATVHTIKCVGTDDMEGSLVLYDTSATDIMALAFAATATDDTISMDGTTRSGVRGTVIELEDIESGLWSVKMRGPATGSYATPFSATV